MFDYGISEDFKGGQSSIQRNAQRFIASLADNLRDMRVLRNLSDLRELSDLLLKREVVETAKTFLSAAGPTQKLELLAILLGRILQIRETGEEGESVEREIQQIAQMARDNVVAANSDNVHEAALDVLRYLPVRSATEVRLVLHLAQDTTDEQVQIACGRALKDVSKENTEALKELIAEEESSVKAIREAVTASTK